MKAKLHSILLSMCVTACIPTIYAYNQEIDRNEILRLFAPVDVSTEGIANFLKNVYNRKEYLDVLPNNMSHLVQFLQHGKDSQQNREYTQSVIRLFSNKLKAAQYINAYAFSLMLTEFPELVVDHFEYKRADSFDARKEMLNTILYETFLAKYDNFKKNPKDFFDALSHEILDTFHQDVPSLQNEDISADELRKTIIRFLECSVAKLIWSPDEHGKVWQNVKTIAKHFETLVEYNIITDSNDLDDLYWSLIHRFCYFLQLASPELPVEFYEEIKNDLASTELLLLELEEQEELIETKRDCLTQAIFEGQARKQAIDMGVIVG